MIFRIKKYYCPKCRKFRSHATRTFGRYKMRNGSVYEGIVRTCPYCDNPVINVKERFMAFVEIMCSTSEYEDWREFK